MVIWLELGESNQVRSLSAALSAHLLRAAAKSEETALSRCANHAGSAEFYGSHFGQSCSDAHFSSVGSHAGLGYSDGLDGTFGEVKI